MQLPDGFFIFEQMKTLTKEDLTRIGFVNKTSGFNGKIKCIIDLARPKNLSGKKFLFLIIEGLPVPFAVEEMELNEDELIVKLEDVNSEEQAKKLLRTEVYSEKFTGKKKSEIGSWKDLIGYTATDENYGEIGIISEVLEYPMQMIAKCMVNDKEILFPLNDEIVLEIDGEEKNVFVELPEGLMDIYLK